MSMKTINDPAIEQIREIRHQISAEFGHDPQKVLAYYAEFEKNLLREREVRAREKQSANAQAR